MDRANLMRVLDMIVAQGVQVLQQTYKPPDGLTETERQALIEADRKSKAEVKTQTLQALDRIVRLNSSEPAPADILTDDQAARLVQTLLPR